MSRFEEWRQWNARLRTKHSQMHEIDTIIVVDELELMLDCIASADRLAAHLKTIPMDDGWWNALAVYEEEYSTARAKWESG